MQTDPLSATFAALADPTRRAILARLATGEATVTELAAPFSMSLPGVSKHLKVLEVAKRCSPLRVAIEFRHSSWFDGDNREETLEFLRSIAK